MYLRQRQEMVTKRETPYTVPSAGTVRVRALVASELVDEDAGVAVVVSGAAAPTASAAGMNRRAVGLVSVLQSTGLI